MSSHFASSHNGGSHYASSHYGALAIVTIVPGGGIEDGWIVTGRRRRLREQEELELLILMVGVIEHDRNN